MPTLEGVVLTYFQNLEERLTGSTEEESHKAAALLQREARATQEPLSIQQCQFNRRPLRNAEYCSFLAEAEETRSSGPCRNQGCDLARHIRKVSLFFAVSSGKAARSEIWGRTPRRSGSVRCVLTSCRADDTGLA